VQLTLKIRVIDVRRCAPIHSAAVDIWHCDAGGLYSDEASNGTSGQTYLRGVQLTNRKGFATFRTVYPGHYTGRATHIHMKVHIGGKARGGTLRGGHVSHTGQLFFAESANSSVYALAPYSSDTAQRTLNSSDSIYGQAGGSRAEVTLAGSASGGYVGKIVVGVNPKATPAAV
jgi:protocatechuate 3,4-dioxygenase beta subunit